MNLLLQNMVKKYPGIQGSLVVWRRYLQPVRTKESWGGSNYQIALRSKGRISEKVKQTRNFQGRER